MSFTIGCAIATADDQWIPTAIGFAVMVSMYSMADVSGGHLNPAVSIALAFSGNLKWGRCGTYVIAQIFGAFVAALLIVPAFDESVKVKPLHTDDTLYKQAEALALEGVYTGFFCFIALGCLAAKRTNPGGKQNQFFGLAIGFSVIAAAHATSHATRVYFNPAVCLSYGILNFDYWLWGLSFAGVQLLGAAGAAVLYFIVRPEESAALNDESTIAAVSHRIFSCCASCTRRKPASESEAVAGGDEDHVVANAAGPMVTAKFASELIGTFFITLTAVLVIVNEASIDNGGSKTNDGGDASSTANTTASLVQTSAKYIIAKSNSTLGSVQAVHANATAVGGVHSDDVVGNSAPWATGCAILAATYALADICGGHFNPVITLAAIITRRGKCSVGDAFLYWIAQGLATVGAACVAWALMKDLPDDSDVLELGPKKGYTWTSVATGETSFSIALTMVVLCVTCVTSPRYPKATKVGSFPVGFAAGMCYAAASFALLEITGGILNPCIGAAMNMDYFLIDPEETTWPAHLLSYCAWETLGGLLAALLFMGLHPLEYKRDPLAPPRDGWAFEW